MIGRWQGSLVRADRHLEERIVWLFGSPRTGSTWLLSILGAHERTVAMDEPNIGMHLAPFMQDVFGAPAESFPPGTLLVNHAREDNRHYFFARQHERAWRPELRRMLLARFGSQLGARRRDGLCVIKEPNGSQAADVVLSTLPRSRLVFLIRDGRDVLDSQLDAAQRGSWLSRSFGGGVEMGRRERLDFLRTWAHKWLVRTEVVDKAYREHDPERRLLLRYEDLRTDTLTNAKRLFEWLDLEIEPDALEEIVASRAFERIPERHRGTGEFARAATPGLWHKSFSEEEQDAVESIIGPKLAELGYDVGAPVA
jgi:sulfotransferase family protein